MNDVCEMFKSHHHKIKKYNDITYELEWNSPPLKRFHISFEANATKMGFEFTVKNIQDNPFNIILTHFFPFNNANGEDVLSSDNISLFITRAFKIYFSKNPQ